MNKNAVLKCVKPADGTAEKDEILALMKKLIEMMNRCSENLDTRLQLMEEKLDRVDRLIQQMNINR